jgi:hypothetical protein
MSDSEEEEDQNCNNGAMNNIEQNINNNRDTDSYEVSDVEVTNVN